MSRWNSSFKFHCQGILYFISVDLASPRSDHMKIHVKNIVCSYWNLGNLFSDCEQFQPIFGTPLWPDHSLQCNLWWHCNIWTFHHCPAPVLRGAWALLSLPSCGSSHHLPCLWSRFTSVKFAFGHVDLQLEELLNLIWWKCSLNNYPDLWILYVCLSHMSPFRNPVNSSSNLLVCAYASMACT